MKKIMKSRPSFWIRKTTDPDPKFQLVRVLYPDGKVEYYSESNNRWMKSYYSHGNYKKSLADLKRHHVFLGNT